MNSKEFLKERKRLQGQKDLAEKHGDTKLAESIGRRIVALKHDNPELAGDTLAGFSAIAESRMKSMNESVEKVVSFLQRLADDLGVYPSTSDDSNKQTDKLNKVAPTASKGQPIHLWIGDMLIAILTFSRDGSSVKAVFDDESDKHLIRSYKLAKDDFFEEIDEAGKLKQVKFNASFGDAKNYEKASDLTAALEKMFGASAFQTHEDGSRSFMVDETGMRRLEAFMKREGLDISTEAQESPAVAEDEDDEDSLENPNPFLMDKDAAVALAKEILKMEDGEEKDKKIDRLGEGGWDLEGNKLVKLETDEGTNEDIQDGVPFPELAEQLQNVYMKHFPKGRIIVRKQALGDEGFYVTTFLIGEQKDQSNGIWDNDPLLHTFGFEGIGNDQFEFTRLRGRLSVNPPEGSHLAMSSLKIAFRKTKGDAKKVVTNFEKYVQKMKKLVKDSGDDVYGRDRYDNKYFEGRFNSNEAKKIQGPRGPFNIEIFTLNGNDRGDKADREVKTVKGSFGEALKLARKSVGSDKLVRIMHDNGLVFQKTGDKYEAVLSGNQRMDIDQDKGKFIGEEIVKTGEANDHYHTYDDNGEGGQTSEDNGHFHTVKPGATETDEANGHTHSLSSVVTEEMTKEEAVALAKKAMKASADQKEALMKILANVGYSMKKVDGKQTLVKGKTEVTLEALAEARAALTEDADDLVPFLKELYKGNMFVQLDENPEGSHLGAAQQMMKRADKGDFTVEFVDDQNQIIGAVVFSDDLFPGRMTKEKHPMAKAVEKMLGKHF